MDIRAGFPVDMTERGGRFAKVGARAQGRVSIL